MQNIGSDLGFRTDDESLIIRDDLEQFLGTETLALVYIEVTAKKGQTIRG